MKFNFKLGTCYISGIIVAIIALILDQASKIAILKYMDETKTVPVTPFSQLVLVWNKGISFGMFNSDTYNFAMFLTIGALLLVAGLSVWMLQSSEKWLSLSLGLIIGGALGNVIDRVRMGAVVDFIDLYWGKYHWPAFNVADSCIAIGAFIMLCITFVKNEVGNENAK